jgi:hypothetical protein
VGNGIGDKDCGNWHVDVLLELLQKSPGTFILLNECLDLRVIDG